MLRTDKGQELNVNTEPTRELYTEPARESCSEQSVSDDQSFIIQQQNIATESCNGSGDQSIIIEEQDIAMESCSGIGGDQSIIIDLASTGHKEPIKE